VTKSINQPKTYVIGHEYTDGGVIGTSTRTEQHKRDLISKGHYGYPHYPPDLNVGGAFSLSYLDTWHETSGPFLAWRGGVLNQYYIGEFYANISSLAYSTAIPDISSWGATAFNRMKPTKPLFNGLNALYELREVPKQLFDGFHAKGLHEVANTHLALQLGWLPLLSDIRNFVKSQRKLQDRVKWLLRHNGQPVRRRVQLSSTMTDPVVQTGLLYTALQPGLVTQYYNGQPTFRKTDYSSSTIWASGRFRYWLPGGPRNVEWTKRLMYHLFDVRVPTPSMIYNAIPWSWLNDWFSNTGDILENLDVGVADRLAADYCYLMQDSRTHREYHADGKFHNKDGSIFSVSATSYSIAGTKNRIVGDPFGFSTNPNGLSATQLSILGALGLSRL
jgi:hypothetical protein